MTTRLNHAAAAPKVIQAMMALEKASRSQGLEPSLLELVKTRASQINRCAFCLDMHTREARAAGETEERLTMLAAWEEATCYTPRERAALSWTDADAVGGDRRRSAYAAMAAEFGPENRWR